MKMHKMPHGIHMCLLYSAAMLLDTEPHVLIDEIGHDGTAVVWPSLPIPLCHKSFHIQEIIDCFMRRGFGLMPIDYDCYQAPNDNENPVYTYENSHARFRKIIIDREAIIIGSHKSKQAGHAWAWSGNICYDPNGFIAMLDDYFIKEAWVRTLL